MKINISVYGTPKVLIIRDILFLPGLRFSLLSVKAFGRKGLRSTFDETECEIVRKDNNSMVAVGVSLADFDLYRLTLSEETPIGTYFDAYHAAIKSSTPASTDNESDSPTKSVDITTAHQRLGHLSEGYLRQLQHVSTGLSVKGTFQFCEECALAKQTRRNFKSKPTRKKDRLSRIHLDLSGPHHVSARGERYFLLLLDESTRKRWVYFLK